MLPDEPQPPHSPHSPGLPPGETGNGKSHFHAEPPPGQPASPTSPTSHGSSQPPPLPESAAPPDALPHLKHIFQQQARVPDYSHPHAPHAQPPQATSHPDDEPAEDLHPGGLRPPSFARVALITAIFLVASIALTVPTWGVFLPEDIRKSFLGEPERPDASPEMAMQAKMALGASRLIGEAGQSLSESTQIQSRRSLVEGVLTIPDAGSIPLIANKLIFCKHMDMGSLCEAYIEELEAARPASESPLTEATTPTTALPDPEHNGAAEERLREIVLRMYQQGQSPGSDEIEFLEERLGFFGELAAVQALRMTQDPKADELANQALEESRGFAFKLIVFSALGFILAVVGSVALLLFLAGLRRGTVVLKFRASPGPVAFPFFETFTLYLVIMIAMPLVINRIAPSLRGQNTIVFLALNLIMDVFLLGLAALPVLKGDFNWKNWRELIGWTNGRGALKEIGAGFLGYTASLPLLAVGVLVMTAVRSLTGIEPDQAAHPIYPLLQKFRDDPVAVGLMMILAVIGAPIIEETLFRGALHRGLRAKFRWPVSAAMGAALFAAVHPQGLIGFPLLFAIGLTLSGLREWRGSLIAPMVAHALNNGITLAVALSLM